MREAYSNICILNTTRHICTYTAHILYNNIEESADGTKSVIDKSVCVSDPDPICKDCIKLVSWIQLKIPCRIKKKVFELAVIF
jgi:hypothetical protein